MALQLGSIDISSFISRPSSVYAATFADRLNFKISAMLFAALTGLTILTSFVGDPIDCWPPEYFTSQWVHYVDNYCWIRNTYYLPSDISVDKGRNILNITREIQYYQWVPFVLLTIAGFYYLPNIWWDGVVNSTFNIHKIIEAFKHRDVTIDKEERTRVLDHIVRDFSYYLRCQNFKSSSKLSFNRLQTSLATTNVYILMWGSNVGNYISPRYIILKVIYLVINIVTMSFLCLLFGKNYITYGIDVSRGFLNKTEWSEISSDIFPTVTLCDFTIRQLGQPKTHTVQCILIINLFNEKIFALVWFWLIICSIVAFISLFRFAILLFLRSRRMNFVRKTLVHLMPSEERTNFENSFEISKVFNEFVDEFLKPDGVFILYMIQNNTNAYIHCEFVYALWTVYMAGDEINNVEVSSTANSSKRSRKKRHRSRHSKRRHRSITASSTMTKSN